MAVAPHRHLEFETLPAIDFGVKVSKPLKTPEGLTARVTLVGDSHAILTAGTGGQSLPPTSVSLPPEEIHFEIPWGKVIDVAVKIWDAITDGGGSGGSKPQPRKPTMKGTIQPDGTITFEATGCARA